MQVQGTRYPMQAYNRNIYRIKCALKNLMSYAEVLEHDQPLEYGAPNATKIAMNER